MERFEKRSSVPLEDRIFVCPTCERAVERLYRLEARGTYTNAICFECVNVVKDAFLEFAQAQRN